MSQDAIFSVMRHVLPASQRASFKNGVRKTGCTDATGGSEKEEKRVLKRQVSENSSDTDRGSEEDRKTDAEGIDLTV